MERRKAIKLCCVSLVGIPVIGIGLQSCSAIYYATASQSENKLVIFKTEFQYIKKEKINDRKFVLVEIPGSDFPVCLYHQQEDTYVASLLRCTHRSCELNVGGGIYSCPCHGSEFAMTGKVIEGPAIEDLLTFKTTTDHDKVFIYIA